VKSEDNADGKDGETVKTAKSGLSKRAAAELSHDSASKINEKKGRPNDDSKLVEEIALLSSSSGAWEDDDDEPLSVEEEEQKRENAENEGADRSTERAEKSKIIAKLEGNENAKGSFQDFTKSIKSSTASRIHRNMKELPR
jgi:phage I-like protein